MRRTFVPMVGSTLLAMAACSSSEAGAPRAAEPGPTTEAGTAPSTPAPGARASLGALDPCTLLSDSDRARLGLAEGDPGKVGESKECDWTKSADWGVSIALHANVGFSDANLQGATSTSVNIGRHKAHKVENLGGGAGGCVIILEVGASSITQVSATASGGRDTPKACGKATQVAQIIDPKLP